MPKGVEHMVNSRAVARYNCEPIFDANAGLYRRNQDPKNGIVLFGARQQFQGASPDAYFLQKELFPERSSVCVPPY
ncbi:MAG: hypothetical protein D3924_13395 [Candidatus Electrothrix sp. AR4]|nr:hypothetical protein [Candidatus Electrothrix sp. AR4]